MKKILLGATFLAAAFVIIAAASAPVLAQTNFKLGWIDYNGDWNGDPGAYYNLRDQIAARTGYNVTLGFPKLDSLENLSQYHMLILTGHNYFSFSEADRANLKTYLENGGLLFADDCNNVGAQGFEESFNYEMSLMFPANSIFFLPTDHPIFDSFYIFRIDPTRGHNTPPTEWTLYYDTSFQRLKGFLVNGSVRVVYNDNDYSCGWGNEGNATTAENSFQVGVNAAAYALQSPSGSEPPPSNPARVDLVLEWSDISFWTHDGLTEVTNPEALATVLIRAVVHNISTTTTSAPGSVYFYDAFENLPEVPITNGNGTNVASLPAIPPGETRWVEIPWTPTIEQSGYHLIRAWVYPDVNESYGYNNSATHFIVRTGQTPAGEMNIDVLSLSICEGCEYAVSKQVLLSGYVQYRWGNGFLLPLLGGDVTITLGGQTWTTHTLNNGMFYQWITMPSISGSYTLAATATDATITGTTSVNITVASYPPDLVIQSITLDQAVATTEDNIRATVKNQGTQPLPAQTFYSTVTVTYPDGQTVWNGSVNTTLTEDLQPGQTVDVVFTGFTPPDPGVYQISVTVDPSAAITEEPNKSNNTLSLPVRVWPNAFDLRVGSLTQSCNTFTAIVSNQGGLPSGAETVTFSDNHGWSIEQPLSPLTAKVGWISIPFEYTGTGGLYTPITAAVSSTPPGGDYNPGDNTLTVYTNPFLEVDFFLSEIGVNDRSMFDTNLVYTTYPNTIKAQIQNVGCNGASGQVQFFVSGVPVGTSDTFTLNAGSNTVVSLPYDFPGYTPATNYSLTAVVSVDLPDSDAYAYNNTRTEDLIVAPQPCDLNVHSADIQFATYPHPPQRNDKFRISATIHNDGPAYAKDFVVAFFEEGLIPIGGLRTFHLDQGIPPDGDMLVEATEDWGYGFSGNHAIIVQVAPLAGIQDDPDDTDNTANRAVWINHPPHAEETIISQTTTSRQNDTVSLSSAGSNDDLDAGHPEQWVHEIVRYDWDFDDGQSAADGGSTLSHRYTDGGIYHAKLTVTDNSNETSTVAEQIVNVPYRITLVVGPGGTVSPAGPIIYVAPTSQFQLNITPNPGYHVEDVLVEGVSQGPITVITRNVNSDLTITVTFDINRYTITPAAGPNGSIDPATAQSVPYDGSQAFTITADAGYHIERVEIDGISSGSISSYTFDLVRADHTISALFGKDPVASFTGNPTRGFRGMTVAFTNASTEATTYSWSFGDGGTSTAVSPAHAYPTNGIRTVSLAASGSSGQPSDASTMTRTDYICVGYIFSNDSATSSTAPFTRAYYLGGKLYARAWVAKADVDYARLSSMKLRVTDSLGAFVETNLTHEGTGNYAGNLTLTGLAAGNATATITITDRNRRTFSATEAITLAIDPRPAAPTNLAATAGNGQVTLTWDNMHASNPNILGYRIYRGTGGAKSLLTEVGLVTTYLDQSVTNGQTYYYNVRSYTATEESADSNEAFATPSASNHAKVTNLETGSYVKGKWTPATSFARGAKVVIRCTVIDVEANQPLPNAVVYLHLSGANNLDLVSGPSNTNGVAEATWATSSKTATGNNTAAVTNVVRNGYLWDGTPISINITIN